MKKVQVRTWLAMLAAAALLVGCGIFFAFQDLGRADQYASVASFFLALLTAAGSVLALARARSGERAGEEHAKDHKPDGNRTTLNLAWQNDVVVSGEGSTVNITKTVESPSPKGKHPNH
jgi:hypothetical protein